MSDPITKDGALAFLEEAARFFETMPTTGEDRAYWANHCNATNCRKIAAMIRDGLPPPPRKAKAMQTEPTTLIERVEAASASDQARLIEEAFWAVMPNYADPRAIRAMLDAEAYESAAMLLVPEWCHPRIFTEAAQVIMVAWTDGVGWEEVCRSGLCATPALALLAACLKARAA